jgi:hypothetical protein
MPYYLFKINVLDELKLIKHLELLEVYDAYQSARNEAKKRRTEQPPAEKPPEGVTYKVMFAENQLAAEESLLEKREKPVLMEYER